ncbi:MAG: NADH-quinone oxidoreductase subunit J [Phycisphaerales bacterium]
MEAIASPILIYAFLTLGAFGVALAMPRQKVNPQLLGALIAAAGIGGVFLTVVLTVINRSGGFEAATAILPNAYFYIFAAIAVGSSLRVITHSRPVYSALYFILTILSSSALYLLLGAEFLAFALIIIYAGAILITYLFVIMLATQAPSENDPGSVNAYDKYSREPVVSTAVGFVLIAVLTGILSSGVPNLDPNTAMQEGQARLGDLPKKIVSAYDRLGLFQAVEEPDLETVATARLDIDARTMSFTVSNPEELEGVLSRADLAELLGVEHTTTLEDATAMTAGDTLVIALPDDVIVTNIDSVGFALIAEHPMALELAGVILLMAMLGAVVLARKQIEIGEAEKSSQATVLGGGGVI